MDENKTKTAEEKKPRKEEIKTNVGEDKRDDAGPSGSNFLPGAVQSPRSKLLSPRAGLSKSEHNIRSITNKDVTDALESLSFGSPKQGITNLNIREIKIPIIENNNFDPLTNKTDSAALIDLKKFMASCFKITKENAIAIPLQILQNSATIPNETVEPNASRNVETECSPIPNLPTEVVVTSNIQPILSKTEKKKTSGNLSEKSDVGARDSLSSIGSNVCRICMTRGRERLISPCNCKGSLANVHLTCLERWLNQVGRNHCELCGFSYPAIRTPRYTVLQALRLWFGNPRNRSHLQSDCLIFWLLSTVTAGLLAVCIVGTQYFVIEGNKFGKIDAAFRKEEGISHRITETAMDFFMAIVLCGYSVTVYLLWKDHYVMWNRWRRANVNVRLLLAPDTTPVPFAPRPDYHVV